ncbi:putative oxidoreductase [Ulvibacter sp. MAR_2010_11]|uniref:DoxX family protein n=1 Tax=Ulvibacter sp. MAR_2010_11 TaxID=1250229 RepID=UPI000C2BB64E|nr:DoxX family protein [Ulvibacter sp. MAR_2010_11]PKA84556.1 putative oxidoreductase [Ulvibacter sp. MAR_2010_11]
MSNATRYNIGLLLLRLSFSALILLHGIPKLIELLQGNFEFGDPLGMGEAASKVLAVIGEVICPILIIIGYKTRWAAIPTIITMGVVAFIVQAADPIGAKEKALLFLFGFLVIALLGAGKYSIDKK